ncbi:MAG TPA: conjugative transposon protein TraJ [Ohtaekwangia sp.]|nr:conjugative transposon protein TraJ [Ohtaekwangia sp.]
MKRRIVRIGLAVLATALPQLTHAQTTGGEIANLQSVLDTLYDEMIPLCSQLIDVGRGLSGFAALWYIASRVWRHIANAEAVDLYPLLRPFVIGFSIMMFPSVLALINGVMKPTISGTASMVEGSNNAIAELLKKKEQAIQKTPYWQMYVGADGNGDKEKWYRYTHPEGTEEGFFDGIGNDIKFAMAKASYNFRNSIKQWMSEVLHILFEAAGLCINTIRTFHLIVLAILGPLVLGLSVFDGFQHTLRVWLARYINVFLWLPVANIFGSIIGKIQENMLKVDIQQVQKYGDTFFSSTDTAYLIFMVIGIVGYFTVPSVANYIVHAGGGNVLLFKATNLFSGGVHSAANATLNRGRSMMSSLDLSKYQTGNDRPSRSNTQPTALEIKKDSEGGYMHRKVSGQ